MTDTALRIAAAEPHADIRDAGEAALAASITVLTNRAVRTGWADDDPQPMLPLARGLKLYIEGIHPTVAAQFGEVVETPEEADAAILRLRAPLSVGALEFPADVLDHVRAIAATVPTVVDVFAGLPVILEPIVDVAVAVTLNRGASAAELLDVLTGAAEPQGRLPFDLPRSRTAVAASRPDVPFEGSVPLFAFGHGLSV